MTASLARNARRRAVARSLRKRKPSGPPAPPARLLDPSRTGQLRVKAGAAVRARYDRLRTELWKAVVLEDALGLGGDAPDWFTLNYSPSQPRGEDGRWVTSGGDHLNEHESAALDSARKTAEAFGIPVKETHFHRLEGERTYGEHGADKSHLVNVHTGQPINKQLNFKPDRTVTEGEHLAAHEVVHQAFSADAELGQRAMERLKNVKAEFGNAVSLYGAFNGPHENLMELGASYVHSPEALKRYSLEMYEIAHEWATALKSRKVENRDRSAEPPYWEVDVLLRSDEAGGSLRRLRARPGKFQHVDVPPAVRRGPGGQENVFSWRFHRPQVTANEQARDARGRWAAVGGRTLDALKRAGAYAGHLEHSAKRYVEDRLEQGVSRLPPGLQHAVRTTVHVGKVGTRAAFVTWTAGQALAERVSRERGATPDQARRLRGVLSALDVATFKPVSLALAAGGVSTAALGVVSFVPPASAAYLAYSTARDPLVTWRAAKGLVSETAYRVGVRVAGGTVRNANDEAWNVFCPTGEGGGIDPTCSPGGTGGGVDIHSMDDATVLAVFGVVRREEPADASYGIQSSTFTGMGRLEEMEKLKELEKRAGMGRRESVPIVSPTIFQPFNSTWAGTAIPASVERVLGVGRSDFDLQREASAKKDAKGYGKRNINNDMNANGWSRAYRADDATVDKFVKATYEKTQEVLKANGVTEIKLYRGTSQPDGKGNAVESWTADKAVAEGFAKAMGGAVQVRSVPADRVFATPAVGWGVGSQVEVLVLGDRPRSPVTNAASGSSWRVYEWEKWLKGDATPTANSADDVVREAAAWLARHDGDWSFAVLLAATEEAGDLRAGLTLARVAVEPGPNDPTSFNVSYDYVEDVAPTLNAPWSFLPTADKLKAFGEWLKGTAADLWRGLEETLRGIAELAIRRGAGRSFDESRSGHFLDPNFRPAAKDQFLDGVFRDDGNRQRFDALKKRIGDEAVNHRDSVVEKVERSISDAVVQDKSPTKAWREISTIIDRERASAVTTVTDEVVRGHAEGQVAGFEEAGVGELFPLMEWTTHPEASRSGVCPRCRAMRGTVWTIEEARGKIPLHRNCRCSWTAKPHPGSTRRERLRQVPTLYAPGAGAKFKGNTLNADAAGPNCGTGPGGFRPGNTCAAGGGGLEARPMRLFGETPAPGNGGRHLDHVTVGEGEHGALVRFKGYEDVEGYDKVVRKSAEYELVGREEREAGRETVLRDVHPDEPHSGRDHAYVKGYALAKGGGFVDTSPENPGGVSATALKFWSTPGTKKAKEKGGNPQHSVIRDAADRKFGVAGSGADKHVVDPLPPDKAEAHAKNLINKIADAPPAQPTLWRGIYGDQGAAVLGAAPGDTLRFTLGSTSRDANAARVYAGQRPDSVMVRILPGARGVANRDHYAHDQEVVTGGTFEVVGRSVSEKTGLTVVDVVQKDVFRWK